jgi:glycine cleavage system H lipoate-binding protein
MGLQDNPSLVNHWGMGSAWIVIAKKIKGRSSARDAIKNNHFKELKKAFLNSERPFKATPINL